MAGEVLLRTERAVVSKLQLRVDSWPEILPLIQAALNLSPTSQRDNITPSTAFAGQPAQPPISTIVRSDMKKIVTIMQLQRESAPNITGLQELMDDLCPQVQTSLRDNRRCLRRHICQKGVCPTSWRVTTFTFLETISLKAKSCAFAREDRGV